MPSKFVATLHFTVARQHDNSCPRPFLWVW